MTTIQKMLENNRRWAREIRQDDPDFFRRLARAQNPEVLWIGCSDSRVGPERLVSLPMGSIFVHRNIANVFALNDLNCLAVLEYAVDELKVPNVIVCGHYGCGGIQAALEHSGIQPVDLWIDQVRMVFQKHREELLALDREACSRRLAELNVYAQVHNLCSNTIVREAWKRGQELNILGVIYDIHDGLLKPLGSEIRSLEDWQAFHEKIGLQP
ncbi:MAG: carbonic anhydrase [Zetaproteobacteria bacterium]|nr:MAG: carbonic anhydrase [Zetaproteobacteria bacterium]